MNKRAVLLNDIVSWIQSWKNEFSNYFNSSKTRKRILLYHVIGLSYGGTEKSLQYIAAKLDKSKYDVYFMYSERSELFGNVTLEDMNRRKADLMARGVNFIRMDFESMTPLPGMVLKEANPSPRKVVRALDIDLFITAGAGYGAYPIPTLPCPVMMIDVFGYGKTLSPNVKFVLPISNAVREKIVDVVPKEKIKTLHLPVPRPPKDIQFLAEDFRNQYGIDKDNFVFGRIGRSEDSIFDPIAINAFEQIVHKSENSSRIKYLVVGPCKKLKEIVATRKIPGVVTIDSLATDKEVWAFHAAIDVLAHSRVDGESLGINIIESMAVGNPVITHKSKRWNAHLDYLDESFAYVANTDAVDQYAGYMKRFIDPDNNEKIESMREKAMEAYEKHFSPERYMEQIDSLIQNIFTSNR